MPHPQTDTPPAGHPRRRRPEYRGERQAVLVRLPVDVAAQLRGAAAGRGRSVSETAAALITAGLGRGAAS